MHLSNPVNKYSKETMFTKSLLNDSSEYIGHHSNIATISSKDTW